jgi:acyl-CoA thioesterase-1
MMGIVDVAKFLLLWSVFMSIVVPYAVSDEGSGEVPRKKILVLGDSLSAGFGLDISESYPSILQNRIDEKDLPYTVVNAGVSGDTTAGGLRRLSKLLSQDVSILILALGANDGLRGFPPEGTRVNLEKTIDFARSRNPEIKILLAGMYAPPNMGEQFGEKYQKVFLDVATEKQVVFLPFLLEGVAGEPSLNLPDGIHPNAKGYEVVASTMWQYLEPLL